MRVLVATEKTQGKRENDFYGCVEGELVYFGVACGINRFDPDGDCGCGRSFIGLASGGGTTTAMVRELRKFTYENYVLAMASGMVRQGWWGEECGKPMVESVLEVIEDWPVGTIVERRTDFCVRTVLRR